MTLTGAHVGWQLKLSAWFAVAMVWGGALGLGRTGWAQDRPLQAFATPDPAAFSSPAAESAGPSRVLVPTAELDAIYERLQAAEARLEELDSLQSASYDVLESNDLAAPAGLEDRIEAIEGKMKKDAAAAKKKKDEDAKKPKKWYENVSIRGYAQFRYNAVQEIEDGSTRPQHVGDSSIGDDQEFLIRRARIIFTCQPNEHVRLYLQPDFASSPDGTTNAQQIYFGQVRDWYADLGVDKKMVHRFRVGQSKVPYGWENLQSSQNRLYLDRNDAFNSAVRNERDLGVFYYWTPVWATDLFKRLVDDGLKGSGNYGLFGIGVYNGQGGSFRELNDELHTVARFTYPWCLSNGQIIEAGIQGYTGRYIVTGTALAANGGVAPAGTGNAGAFQGHLDKRIGTTFVVYPQPWGFQTEWTVGRGPALSEDFSTIEQRALYGGYAMVCYKWDTPCHGTVFPFARYQEYTGGYKSQTNAPFSHIREWNVGTEWQFNKWAELVTEYCITDRTNTTATAGATPYGQFDGSVLRFQVQCGF